MINAATKLIQNEDFSIQYQATGFIQSFVRAGREMAVSGPYHGFGHANNSGVYQLTGQGTTWEQVDGSTARVQVKGAADNTFWIVKDKGRWITYEIESNSGTNNPIVQIRTDAMDIVPSERFFGVIYDGNTAYGWISLDPKWYYVQQGGAGACARKDVLDGTARKVVLYCCEKGRELARMEEILSSEFGLIYDRTKLHGRDCVFFLDVLPTLNVSLANRIIRICDAFSVKTVVFYNYFWWNGRYARNGMRQLVELLRTVDIDCIMHTFCTTWRSDCYPEYPNEQVVSYAYTQPVYRAKHQYDGLTTTSPLWARRMDDVFSAVNSVGGIGIYDDENDGMDRNSSIVHGTVYEWQLGTDVMVREAQRGLPIMGASGDQGVSHLLQAFCGDFDYLPGHTPNYYVDGIISDYLSFGQQYGRKPSFGWYRTFEGWTNQDYAYMLDAVQAYDGIYNLQGEIADFEALITTLGSDISMFNIRDERPAQKTRHRRRRR
jgi:hypothetical protein